MENRWQPTGRFRYQTDCVNCMQYWVNGHKRFECDGMKELYCEGGKRPWCYRPKDKYWKDDKGFVRKVEERRRDEWD